MSPEKVSGYVLEDEYRWTNKWITLIGAISLILVSVACLYLEIKAQENLLPSLALAAVLMGVAFATLFRRHKYSEDLKMKYRCDGDCAENRCYGGIHELDVTSPFFAFEVSVGFLTAKGATWYEHYTNLYYNFVNLAIVGAYNAGNGDPAQQERNVRNTLGAIKVMLQAIDAVFS